MVLLAALDFVTAVGTRAAAERDAAEAEAAATLDDDGSDLDEDAERPGGNRVRATSAQLAYEWTLLLRAPSGADELPTLCDVSIGWEPPATRPLPAYLAHLTYLPLEHDGMLEERAALLDQHRDAVLTLEAMALYRRCARAATQAAAQFASRNRWVKMNESEKAKVVERHDEAKGECQNLFAPHCGCTYSCLLAVGGVYLCS
ncbi:MAG: hypothetical protein EOO41_03965 [Methanobacteriota archaeon]|nr:MAG: hypothetical protein EOO41_03965 [Euryarchaeota archaeon]